MFLLKARVANAAYNVRRFVEVQKHRSALPPLSATGEEIVSALEHEGAYRTTLARLADDGVAGAARLGDWTTPLAAELLAQDASAHGTSYVVHASESAILQHRNVLMWGLSERLLSIVEHYLGLPVAYRGITVRRDRADGQQTETRLWHKDAEDKRIVKIIVYLNDVTEDDGPFCYIPKHALNGRGLPGRVSDEQMDALVPRAQQIACTGPAGTVVFADTCSVWHRGKVPQHEDRLTVFYCYNSQMPRQPHHCRPLVEPASFGAETLSPAQQAAVTFQY